MPDDRRFGVVWMGHEAASAAFGQQGAFNDLALGLVRGASEDAVIAAVDRLLAPYGGTGAYGRAHQVSPPLSRRRVAPAPGHGLAMIPPMFFLVAAFLVNMVLARLIALERSQIGLLKAVGYSSAAGRLALPEARRRDRRHRHRPRLGLRLVGRPGNDPPLR